MAGLAIYVVRGEFNANIKSRAGKEIAHSGSSFLGEIATIHDSFPYPYRSMTWPQRRLISARSFGGNS